MSSPATSDWHTSPWRTLAEAAEYARCSAESIRRALFSGDLEGHRVGKRGRWVVHVDSLDAWLRGQSGARQIPDYIVTRRRKAK